MTAMLGAVQIVPPDIRIDPPGSAPFSMTTGRAPSSAAVAPAQRPAMPPPHTSTSIGSASDALSVTVSSARTKGMRIVVADRSWWRSSERLGRLLRLSGWVSGTRWMLLIDSEYRAFV